MASIGMEKALYKQKVICLCLVLKINKLLAKIWPYLLAKKFQENVLFLHSL